MKLYVTPLSRLAETLAQSGGARLLTILSNGAEFARPPGLPEMDCLRLTFNDIAEPREGLVSPSADHVRAILEFAAATAAGRSLVVHCHAGISRSTAAAYIIACARRPDLDENHLADEFRRLSPSATPNALIVALGDAALGRKGRMVEAIRRIGRGAEAFEGVPFRFDLDCWPDRSL